METSSSRPAQLIVPAAVVAVALFIAGCGVSPADAQEGTLAEEVVAFVGVNVVPMDAEEVLENHSVVVRDGRITVVGPSDEVSVPEGAVRVEGAGRYLMPGLAEMHGHIPGPQNPRYTEDVLFLYVSNGVTTVRGMAGHPSHLELRERVANGDLVGPTIYAAGPWFGDDASTPEAAERAVREQHAMGYDLLKMGSIPWPAYERMAQTADEVGIPFAGHIPADVGLERALEAGQTSIDHFDRYVEFLVRDGADIEGRESGFFGSGLVDLIDPEKIPVAAERTREAGTWNVPTLSLVEHLASPVPAEQMAEWPEMQYLPSDIVQGWVDAKHNFQAQDHFRPENAQRLVEIRRELLMALHDAEAPIALGSDAPQFFNVPGFSIHHEMEMMVKAGLTPYQVLVTGTRNPARYFGVPEEFGTVETGRRADLILLEANPLEDISNVRKRAGVMVRGDWLPEGEIQERLEAIAAR